MFHVILSGKIITPDDKALIKKIEDLVKEEKDSEIDGLFVSYKVKEIENIFKNDTNKISKDSSL